MILTANVVTYSCSFCHVNILIENIIQVFFVFYFYILYISRWITIMRYSKHEVITINIL